MLFNRDWNHWFQECEWVHLSELKPCVICPDSKVHWSNMGPTWVLSAPVGPHMYVGPMNLAVWVYLVMLTHWGRVTHICVSKRTIIGSDNGLSPGRRQAIIWTNAGILLIGPLGTNVNETSIEIHTFHSRKCIWKCRLENGDHFVSASMC